MPQALGFVLFGSAAGISVGGIALTTAAGALTIAGTVVSLGITLAITAALAPGAPTAPTPDQAQQNFEAGVGPRLVHIGRAKIGGQKVSVRGKDGKLYILLVQGHGELDAREVHYLDGRAVNLSDDAVAPFGPLTGSSGGFVSTDQYIYNNASKVQILTRKGIVPETYYAELEADFPDWDDTHRLDGLASVLIIIDAPPLSKFNAMFPNRTPEYNCVARWSKFYDHRNGLVEWSENPILALRHYIEGADGLNSLDIDDVFFDAAADDCDENFVTSGGTRKRYLIGGTYRLTDPSKTVIQSILNTCDGELFITPEGKWGVTVGMAIAPTVSLSKEHLISVEWSNGVSLIDAYTTLKPSYTDQFLGYVSESIDPWIDSDLITRYGREIVRDNFELTLVPEHSQARFLAKRRVAKDNPIASGVLRYNLHGLRAYGERFINIDLGLEEFGIDYKGAVRVDNITLAGGNVDKADSVSYVDISVSVIRSDIDDFSVADEGTPPLPVVSDDIPVIPDVAEFAAVGQGTSSAGIAAIWEKPSYDALTPKLEYSIAGADNWQETPLANDADSAQITGLTNGQLYDVRFAWGSPSNTIGNYVTLTNITANADQTTPTDPTAFTITDLLNETIRVNITSSLSADNWRTEIYRNGTLIKTDYSAPSTAIIFVNAAGVGTHTYTALARNIANKVSGTISSTPISITISGGS